ncbi:DUF4226 domain-containing protein [Mycolicibacter senuensis]|uniref:DUF4226 domain-containing protein n=1 Tax=Mycolicibacter senuensis TaxID=386913 RepID=A0A7I9XQA9_9MYCO|nr:DUF4226 domain-containing protein [Mycolicibacter senuensis]ORW66840.1 hypothetical protein AWC24_12800 [Mycolicibacter senuensis]GFG72173.1 hypothetical protein MSEN_38930 [Mycolicibacter senuensis]
MPEELGAHADAARDREAALASRLRTTTQLDRAFVTTLRGAAQEALRGRRRLDAIEAEIREALANEQALALDTPAGARQFQQFLSVKTRDIHRVIDDTVTDSRARAAAVRSLGGSYRTEGRRRGPGVQAVDHTVKKAPGDADERRLNQIDAFREVFGRDPVSASDWTTAAALDAHTYDPKFQGVDSEIRVARIDPVPGQGVVRASQWIPQRDVTSLPPWKRDFGNERGPNPNFDPEDTKVTTYIDYDNGIVVMRQNPSVELNDSGGPGRVKVGVPQGSISQAPDGSVRIKYDAGNPLVPAFATDAHGPLRDNRPSVNGDLVFTPGHGGVYVDGTRTNYPSLEIYQDMPDGVTHTVLIDPARSGRSLGPALNLPAHHEIGVGSSAFAPFGDAATDFGPVYAPPSVSTINGGALP